MRAEPRKQFLIYRDGPRPGDQTAPPRAEVERPQLEREQRRKRDCFLFITRHIYGDSDRHYKRLFSKCYR